jgi:broad specificity phosphatase PhoE
MTRLFLIRHGETDWNREGRVLGRLRGNHLNEKGRREVAALADALTTQGIRAVYTSPLERAKQSAEILCERLDLLDPIVEEDLTEVDAGEWAGRPRHELVDDPIWIQAHEDPVGVRFPNGERLEDAAQRALACIDRLVARHCDETLAVVTHGDVVRSIVAHYMRLPLSEVLRIIFDTASASLIEFNGADARVIRCSWKTEDGRFPLESPFGQ